MEFNITREEVLNLAAQKLADSFGDTEFIEGIASRLIKERVEAIIKERTIPRIDRFLTEQLEGLVSKEFVPVDMWGAPTGKPTTIRDQITTRAKEYWETRVDSEGRPNSSYGSKPRHEYMFSKLVAAEFANAVSQNIVNVAGALKDALIDECNATVRKKIDELIRVKTVKHG